MHSHEKKRTCRCYPIYERSFLLVEARSTTAWQMPVVGIRMAELTP